MRFFLPVHLLIHREECGERWLLTQRKVNVYTNSPTTIIGSEANNAYWFIQELTGQK